MKGKKSKKKMSKSMKMNELSELLCEYGKMNGVDGSEVYSWLVSRKSVVGGVRGRPSKSKVVEQDSESEDLFASLVKSSTFENPLLEKVERL